VSNLMYFTLARCDTGSPGDNLLPIQRWLEAYRPFNGRQNAIFINFENMTTISEITF
jgi:hypothetical protein